jgi:hypothetical protein
MTKTEKQIFSILDVMQVRCDQATPESAVKSFELPDITDTVECDILIVGGGVGGVAAALAATTATNDRLKVCITEETDWLGGQITTQGIPVLDEGRNFLVETSGANRSYQKFRERIRNYYRQHYKLSPESLQNENFNPGNCWDWVSQLSFEPQIAVKVIDELLANANVHANAHAAVLEIFKRNITAKVECNDDRIEQVLTVNLDTGQWTTFKAAIYIDATELGDLLALSGAKYSLGEEAQKDTGEPHANKTADPENVQDYVFPFVVEFIPNTNNIIAKPRHHDKFNTAGKFSFHGYKMFENADKLMPFWTYRRILDKTAFNDTQISNDAAVINWFAGNDFRGHNIIDKQPHIVSEYLSLAKAVSMSFLYWLQTEAPRDEGGKGYPELKLKKDALGTEDGLSKYPYIREARRGQTCIRIKEQDIVGNDSCARARIFDDSVGIGYFPIDIHGKEAAPTTLNPTKHFQVPLGAMLLSEPPSNLVLACKNIGTTHLTNGAYRLHPIEWTIGEAAGALVRYVLDSKISVQDVLQHNDKLRSFQLSLIKAGVPLYWYDDVATDHPDFVAIQFLSISNIMRGDPDNLHFNPDVELHQEEMAAILKQASTVTGRDLSGEVSGEAANLWTASSTITRAQFAVKLYREILR